MLALKSDFTTPQLVLFAKINDHGVRWVDTGQILAHWWHPMAFRVAIDMQYWYWALRLASHRRIVMAIKMACKGGAFVHRCRLFFTNNIVIVIKN
jgi:hypothetical protein